MTALEPTLFASWLQSLLQARSLAMALWAGLAVLTLALLILMRTRWGQVKPLSKCVALSIYAHILFFGYAYGTHLFFARSRQPQDAVVKLQFVDDTQSQEQPNSQEWDRFAVDAPEAIQKTTLGRGRAEDGGVVERTELPGQPVTVNGQANVSFGSEKDPQAQPSVPRQWLAQRIRRPGEPAADLESPSVQPPVEVKPAGPIGQQLQRMAVRPDNPAAGPTGQKPQVPGEVVDVQSRMQRVAEQPLSRDAAAAAAGEADALKKAGAAAIFPPGTVISTAAQDLIRQLCAERGYADAAE